MENKREPELKTQIIKGIFYVEVQMPTPKAGVSEVLSEAATEILRLLINEDQLSGTLGFTKLKNQVARLKKQGLILTREELLKKMRG
jgi:hypothetical protein